MWIPKPGSRKLTGLRPAVGLAAAYFLMPSAAEPQGRPAPQPVVGFGSSSDTSSLVVVVQAANRTPLAVPAQIIIYAENHQRYTEISSTNGNNRFDRITFSLGNYTVEVSAEGYLQESEPVDVMMPNQQQQITISLRSLRDPVGKAVVAQPPLAPKAQKELQKGLAELRVGRDDEARKHLLNALRLAPANPDVNYLLGVLAASLETTARPRNTGKRVFRTSYDVHCLLAQGGARYTENDLKGAKDYLSRATTADSSLWRAYELLARIDLQIGEYPEAQREAEQAVRLGKSKRAKLASCLRKR